MSPETRALVEDVEWMRETGESFERIPARVGMEAERLGQRLVRAGRPDLGEPLRRAAKRERERKAAA